MLKSELDARADLYTDVAAWHAEWRARERRIQKRIGNPAWRAKSRIALDMPPCPNGPGVRIAISHD